MLRPYKGGCGRMHFGEIEVRHLHGGNFYLDGGAMFGVVPKPLWEKKIPADARNRIRLACNVLLLRVVGKNVLVETGNGTNWDAKQRDIYGIEDGDPLAHSLGEIGLAAGDIDVVINTHLHFDHAAGNSRHENGRDVLAFPNAEYVVQRGELEHAENPTERDRASYFARAFAPVTAAGRWRLLEASGDDAGVGILPGVSAVSIPGHNVSIQAIKISGGGKTLLAVADLIPTRHHVPLPWIMGYDLYPVQTLETKRKWIGKMAKDGWTVAFGHDADYAAGMLHESGGKVEFTPVNLNG
jgi:glyoxylase-like metal-dependent hydrolase (beta-lactamase superfamily II)